MGSRVSCACTVPYVGYKDVAVGNAMSKAFSTRHTDTTRDRGLSKASDFLAILLSDGS